MLTHFESTKEDSIYLCSLHFIPLKFFLEIKYFFDNCGCSSWISSFKLYCLPYLETCSAHKLREGLGFYDILKILVIKNFEIGREERGWSF